MQLFSPDDSAEDADYTQPTQHRDCGSASNLRTHAQYARLCTEIAVIREMDPNPISWVVPGFPVLTLEFANVKHVNANDFLTGLINCNDFTQLGELPKSISTCSFGAGKATGSKVEKKQVTKNRSYQQQFGTTKPVILIGDSITKNMGRFGKNCNASIAGSTIETILYCLYNVNFPSSIKHIAVIYGIYDLASTSPSTISATIIEIIPDVFAQCQSASFIFFPL